MFVIYQQYLLFMADDSPSDPGGNGGTGHGGE